MGPLDPPLKPIVAALLVAVGFSGPLLAEGTPPPDPAPVAPQDPAAREADLLAQLAEAEDARAAGLIETELRALWSRSGSAAIDLLLKRGQDALAAGDPAAAVEHLTAAIDWAPDFAEARVARASAYYLTGDAGPAVEDLRVALALEPDHWEALAGFATLLEEIEDREAALEVWRRVTEINPQNAPAAEAVARLETELAGRAL